MMAMGKRGWILLASSVPVLGLLALLAWASVTTGGVPGGFGVNTEFGQAEVSSETPREFSLELLDGRPLNLSSLRGKVVMLDFWSSWCPPCRSEAPALAQVYREYSSSPVEFIGIAIWDQDQSVLDHVNEYQVPYPNGIDGDGKIAIDYGVTGIPEKFFIGPDGRPMKRYVGPMDADRLRRALDELLAEIAPRVSN